MQPANLLILMDDEHSFVFDRSFKSDHDRRVAIASYYALCSFADAQFGRVLAALAQANLEATTRVLYLSDHGAVLARGGYHGTPAPALKN